MKGNKTVKTKKNSTDEMRVKIPSPDSYSKDQKLVAIHVSWPLWEAVSYGALRGGTMEPSSSTKQHYA